MRARGFRAHYLTVGGRYLTPNATLVPTAAYRQSSLTATQLTDFVRTMRPFEELAVNLTVQSVSGTSPTLTVHLLVLDPIESSNGVSTSNVNPPLVDLVVNSTPLAAVGTIRLVLSRAGTTAWVNGTPTDLGQTGMPICWQLNLEIGGTSPVFELIGTYEYHGGGA